jgi:diadenylate cyclase
MTEQSDAVVLVVSEETGALSLAYEGQIYYDLSPEEIQGKLRYLLERPTRGGQSSENSDETQSAEPEEAEPVDEDALFER